MLVLRFIPGRFNSLLYQFLSSELISWNTLTSSSTSKDVRLCMCSALSLSLFMLLLPLSLPSAVLPSSLLCLRSRNFSPSFRHAQQRWFHSLKLRHGVRHHLLITPGPPVYSKPHCLDPDKLSATKEEFSAMEKAGIIRRSSSPWSSPLHMVKKKDGGPVGIIVD